MIKKVVRKRDISRMKILTVKGILSIDWFG